MRLASLRLAEERGELGWRYMMEGSLTAFGEMPGAPRSRENKVRLAGQQVGARGPQGQVGLFQSLLGRVAP